MKYRLILADEGNGKVQMSTFPYHPKNGPKAVRIVICNSSAMIFSW